MPLGQRLNDEGLPHSESMRGPESGTRASKEPEPASADRKGCELASLRVFGGASQLVPPVGHSVENDPHATATLDDKASEIQNEERSLEP
jgi:hypothetical protein